jgi:hypothetical protein
MSDFVSNDASPSWVSLSNVLQAIEQASNLYACTCDCSRCTVQALPSTGFSAPIDALRSCEKSAIAISSPQRAWFWPHHFACSRVISQCALSASTRAGFCLDPMPQS